jgi:hypothetical protein
MGFWTQSNYLSFCVAVDVVYISLYNGEEKLEKRTPSFVKDQLEKNI